jgi:iron complex transport system substrate-binding protein
MNGARFSSLAAGPLLAGLVLLTAPVAAQQRVACVGGALTETAYALGAGGELVAVDDGSIYPEPARALPKLGYRRALSAEGVLALQPTLVLATPDAGPPAVLEQLRAAGVRLVVVPSEHSVAGAAALIRATAVALDRAAAGEELVAALHRDLQRADALLAERRARAPASAAEPRVLGLYARSHGTLHACGEGTAIDAMIRLAGARNALSGLTGSKPLGDEAAAAAAPDVILLPAGSVEVSGGADAVLQSTGLALTPAGRERRLVMQDDLLLLSFGPRTGTAILELVAALHPAPEPAPESAPAPVATPAATPAPATAPARRPDAAPEPVSPR